MTSVSIIIPVYRVSPYIERCLLSVINQTYKGPVECIIVDDKSPDDSIQKATRMISNYSGHIKFTILTHDENLGLSEARNSALRVATGDYVFFLDSDDEMSIYALELLTNKADSHPGIDVVYGGYYHSQYFNVGATNLPDIILGHEACKKAILKPRLLPGFAHNKLIRKGLFRGGNHLYFEKSLLFEDNLWNWNLAKYVTSLAIVPYSTYIYFNNPFSILTTPNPKKISDRIVIAKKKCESIDSVCAKSQLRNLIEFMLNLDSDIRYANPNDTVSKQLTELKAILSELRQKNKAIRDFKSFISCLLFSLELSSPLTVNSRLFWYLHRGAKMFVL